MNRSIPLALCLSVLGTHNAESSLSQEERPSLKRERTELVEQLEATVTLEEYQRAEARCADLERKLENRQNTLEKALESALGANIFRDRLMAENKRLLAENERLQAYIKVINSQIRDGTVSKEKDQRKLLRKSTDNWTMNQEPVEPIVAKPLKSILKKPKTTVGE